MSENGRYVTPVRTVPRTVLSCRLEPSSEQFLPPRDLAGLAGKPTNAPSQLIQFQYVHGCVLPPHPASLYLASRKSKSGRAFTISFLEVPKTPGSNERQVGIGECASALQLFCVRAPAFTPPPSWQARDEALPSGALNDACYTHSRSCETRKVVEWRRRRRRRGERKFKTISALVLHIFC